MKVVNPDEHLQPYNAL